MKLSSANAFSLDKVKILFLVKSLPNNKIFDMSKLKAFAEDKIIET